MSLKSVEIDKHLVLKSLLYSLVLTYFRYYVKKKLYKVFMNYSYKFVKIIYEK